MLGIPEQLERLILLEIVEHCLFKRVKLKNAYADTLSKLRGRILENDRLRINTTPDPNMSTIIHAFNKDSELVWQSLRTMKHITLQELAELMIQTTRGAVPTVWNHDWRTDTARALAISCWMNEPAFPILADALQDVGCNDEPMLWRLRHSPWCTRCDCAVWQTLEMFQNNIVQRC